MLPNQDVPQIFVRECVLLKEESRTVLHSREFQGFQHLSGVRYGTNEEELLLRPLT